MHKSSFLEIHWPDWVSEGDYVQPISSDFFIAADRSFIFGKCRQLMQISRHIINDHWTLYLDSIQYIPDSMLDFIARKEMAVHRNTCVVL